jgi:hypothetical protein
VWRGVLGVARAVAADIRSDLGPFEKGGQVSVADPADADLRPHHAVWEALQERLAEQEFQLTDTTIQGGRDGLPRSVTLLHRRGERYYLVGLPRDVVHGESPYGRSFVASFDFLFPEGSRLYFFTPSCDALHLPLQRTVEAYGRIKAVFVPWLWIRPHNGRPKPAADLLNALSLGVPGQNGMDVIGLNGNGAGQAPQRQLTKTDIDIVAAMFTAIMATNGDQEFFQDFIDRLDLSDLLRTRARAHWSDVGGFAARALLTWAREQGSGVVTKVLVQLIEEGAGRDDALTVLKILEDCAVPGHPAVEIARESVQRARG